MEIAPLPGVASLIDRSIARHGPSTDTPTAPALQGALDHAQRWATAHPGHVTTVILATDGEPTECTARDDLGSIDAIAAAGKAGAAGAPAIATFVIGVGTSIGNLDGIAQAGGSSKAFLVDTSGDVAQQFLSALVAIRGAALGCSYAVPVPASGGTVDYGSVNVAYTAGVDGGTGAPLRIPNVASASACPGPDAGAANAWFYDDPAAPTKILFCDAMCKRVAHDPGAVVSILTGCATEVLR